MDRQFVLVAWLLHRQLRYRRCDYLYSGAMAIRGQVRDLLLSARLGFREFDSAALRTNRDILCG